MGAPYRTEIDRSQLRRVECVRHFLSWWDRTVADILVDRWFHCDGLNRAERETLVMLIRRAEAAQDGMPDPYAGIESHTLQRQRVAV